MNFHLLDDKHIEVLAGDIASGLWNFADDALTRDGEKRVPLQHNTKSLEIRLKREAWRLDTLTELPLSSLVSVGLSIVLGPLGSLAGSTVELAAGRDKFFCVGCQMKDGRKFIAYMRESVLNQWCKSCPDAHKFEKKK